MDSEGKPFAQNAQTVDITRMGARIQPVHCIKRPGDVIAVQHGEEKARFRVVWVGRPGTQTEGVLGLHCVEPEKFIWKTAWPKDRPVPAIMTPTPMPGTAIGRRLHQRHTCSGGAQIKKEGTKVARWATVSDISLTGAYLDTTEPLDPQTRVELTIKVEDLEFKTNAIVRVAKPAVGMGVAFTEMSVEDRDKLDQLINYIEDKERYGPAGEGEPAVRPPQSQQASNPMEAPVVLPRAAEFSVRMQNINNDLRDLEKLLSDEKEHVDPRVLRDFHNAVVHLRQVAWGVQQWVQLKTQNRDPFDVLAQIHGERMRFSTELEKELSMDLESMELELTNTEIPAFFTETKRLYKALARALGKDEEHKKPEEDEIGYRGRGSGD